jgi:hypothetical protein
MSVNEKMTAIADAIREKTGSTEPLTLDDMAENIPSIYDAGKKSQYDEFWDSFQQNGARTNYALAFGSSWGADILKPKYDIRPETCYMMFRQSRFSGDLAEHFNKQGIVFDTSNCSTFEYFFYSATRITRIGTIDFTKAKGINNAFAYMTDLKTIDKLICSETTKVSSPWFINTTKLQNVSFEGVFAANGLDLSPCKLLTVESIRSLIGILKDYSTSGTTYTLTLGTTNLAKLTDNEKAIATEKGWTLA